MPAPPKSYDLAAKTGGVVEECNELPVHPRHPYAGDLVYTAFSGSHQDAIKKGMYAQERAGVGGRDVPTCRSTRRTSEETYEAIIRVNSQSGKGGVAYLWRREHQLDLPRGLQVDFARRVQQIIDARGGELTPAELMRGLRASATSKRATLYELVPYTHSSEGGRDHLAARVRVNGEERRDRGGGDGPLAALVHAFARVRDRDPGPRLPRARDVGGRGRARRRRTSKRTWARRPSGASASTVRSSPRRFVRW